jgi:uncharacterized protein YegL
MKKRPLNEHAVSEIVAMLIILSLAIVATAGLYTSILSDEGPSEQTFVKIKGFVEGRNIVLEHQGGEEIPGDSWISIKLPDSTPSGPISSFLVDLNGDGKWNIGEKLQQHFEYDLSKLDEYTVADVMATDKTSNSIELMGPIDFKPVSDTGLRIYVNNTTPKIDTNVTITIEVTSYGGDVNGSGGVIVNFPIPPGLLYINHDQSQGSYDVATGEWDAGNVIVGSPATLNIVVQVVGIEERESTQLIMILDGSGSISESNFNLMKNGLSNAIGDPDIIPHDESVEISVVQFGEVDPPYSRIELSPLILNDINYPSAITTINGISQMVRPWNGYSHQGATPIGCGFRLATDVVKGLHPQGSSEFSFDDRQLLILVTDGLPNCEWIPGTYTAIYRDSYYYGKISAENARDYAISTLGLQNNQDLILSLAVENGPDLNWLNQSIVWPEPGQIYYNSPSENASGGWVCKVSTWEQFATTLEQTFRTLFQSINSEVSVIGSTTIDHNSLNNNAAIKIYPHK